MSRKIIVFLILITAVIGCTKKHKITGVDKIILISIDDLRADFLGIYNNKMKASPVIDRLAAENIYCTNVTSQAAETGISHKSILTSLYPSVHKTSLQMVAQPMIKTPVEILHDNGFKTAAFVGGVQINKRLGFDKGFDTFQPRQKFEEPDAIVALRKHSYEWLSENYDQPFFLFLHTYAVHCPFDPPEKYFQKFAAWYKGNIDRKFACGGNYYNLRPMSAEDIQYVKDLYAGQVNYVDDFMDGLINHLKKLGIYDQTMIVFLSDHGESLGERKYVGHNQLYGTQLHIPLIIRIPGYHSIRIDAPLESVDVMPTIFAVSGLGRLFPFEGQNLLPLIRGQVKFPADRIRVSENMTRVRVMKNNWACIFERQRPGSEELYDNANDPLEMDNLAPKNPEMVDELRKSYFRIFKQYDPVAKQFVVTKGKKPQLTEQEKEQLRALGYVTN